MRLVAVAVEVTGPVPPIQLVCNPVAPNIVKTKIIDKKYKRVDRDSRIQFLDYLAQGRSISQAAKELGINYSTAKSIAQNHRKKAIVGPQHNLETDSCQTSKENF